MAVTAHRRRIDMIGLLVLCEITTTITLSLATHSLRIAALREALLPECMSAAPLAQDQLSVVLSA